MNEEEKERLIKKDIESIENRVRHAFNQGYEMGLKERQNTCEDAISRQAAIDAVDNVIADYIPILLGRYEALPLEMALAINRLPSVNPQHTEAEIQKMQELEQAEIQKAYELGKAVQPKTGHWISHYDEDAKEGWYECDRCHTERAFNTDYCPDCGAKMVEQREGEG